MTNSNSKQCFYTNRHADYNARAEIWQQSNSTYSEAKKLLN